MSVINPNTNKKIKINGDVFNKLIKDGYVFDGSALVKIDTIMVKKDDTNLPKNMNMQLKIDKYIFENIIHISDIHIPLKLYLKRNDEYKKVFINLIKEINKVGKHFVVISGDLFHVKLLFEPETLLLVKEFLEMFNCPVVIIAGNHDMNESNLERLDNISPICDIKDVYFLKDSGVYKFGNVLLSVSSLIDKCFIKRSDIVEKDITVYAIYHGTINGSTNDDSFVFNNEKYKKKSDFDGFDGVLLGDIHKYQMIDDRMGYAGSLIQQNYGEKIENHGMIIWNIKNKKTKFVSVFNEYVFINVDVNGDKISYDELDLYKDRKMRIKLKVKNTGLHNISKIEEELKKKYNVEELIIENIYSDKIDVDVVENDFISLKNDIALINEICENTNIKESVIKLHSDIYSKFSEECISSCWNIESVRFKNMFIYGNDNENYIDFIHGVNNICSRNMTGKSSIVNILNFALFDTIGVSKEDKTSIIHCGKNNGYIKLNISCNGVKYLIEKVAGVKTRSEKDIVSIIFKTKLYKNNNGVMNDISDTTTTLTCQKIKQMLGDSEIFISHNVISTKYNHSLLYLTPLSRYKHFESVFKIEIYNKCKEYVKKLYDELKSKYDEIVIKCNTIKDCVMIKNVDEIRKCIIDKTIGVNEMKKQREILCDEKEELIKKMFSYNCDDIIVKKNKGELLKELKKYSMIDGETIYSLNEKIKELQMNDKIVVLDYIPLCKKDLENNIKQLENDKIVLLGKIKPFTLEFIQTDESEDSLIKQLEELKKCQFVYNDVIDFVIPNVEDINNVEERLENNKIELKICKQKLFGIGKMLKPNCDISIDELMKQKVYVFDSSDDLKSLIIKCDEFEKNIKWLYNVKYSEVGEVVVSKIQIDGVIKFIDSGNTKEFDIYKKIDNLRNIENNKKIDLNINYLLHNDLTCKIKTLEKEKEELETYIKVCRKKKYNEISSSILLVEKKLYYWWNSYNERIISINNEIKKMNKEILWHNQNDIKKYSSCLKYINLSNEIKMIDKTCCSKLLEECSYSIKIITDKINDETVIIDGYKKDISTFEKHNSTLSSLRISLDEYSVLLKIYKEYLVLFNHDNIPVKVLSNMFKSFNKLVNDIFFIYTGYTFRTEINDKNKITFVVNKVFDIDPCRLSGFETIILNIAINQAIMNVSNGNKCSFLIVDESLDCIDSARFDLEIPRILNTIRRYYDKILLISHRDIDDELIDKQLKISYYGGYSTIRC